MISTGLLWPRPAQGRGIGHALLARVEAEVQTRGGRLLLIETSGTPAYAPARRSTKPVATAVRPSSTTFMRPETIY
jgi:GNAT superfamily N-acetyltransferase